MTNIKMPHFGHIDSDSLEEFYDVDIPFAETEIQIDLNFDNKIIDLERLEAAKQFIENIRIHDLNNLKYIESNYIDKEGGTIKFYLEHHLEELGDEELSTLIDLNSKSTDHEKQLLKKLHLIRVGLYPDSENKFATFDYSIGKELTDQLLVIVTDKNGNIDHITIES